MRSAADFYVECLGDITARLNFIRSHYVAPAAGAGASIMQFESAVLQLRMAVEFAAFASIGVRSGDGVWDALSRENNFNLALKKAERLNPNFFPVSVKVSGVMEFGTPHIQDAEQQMSREILSEIYGRASNVLHARSLARYAIDYSQEQEMLRRGVRLIPGFLRFHVASLSSGDHLLVDMIGGPKGGPIAYTLQMK